MKSIFKLAAIFMLAGMPQAYGQETAPAAENNIQRFDDWAVACPEDKDGAKQPCQAVQRLTMSESGQQIMQISVAYLEGNDSPVAVFILPLGMLLQQGALLSVDGEEVGRIAIQRCEAGGCIAPLLLSDEVIAKFKAGSKGQIVVRNATGRELPIPVSLGGFTAALAALK